MAVYTDLPSPPSVPFSTNTSGCDHVRLLSVPVVPCTLAVALDMYKGSEPEGGVVDQPEGGVRVVVLKLNDPPVGVAGVEEALLYTLSKATELPSLPSIPSTPSVSSGLVVSEAFAEYALLLFERSTALTR
jgi:hypothetical protein